MRSCHDLPLQKPALTSTRHGRIFDVFAKHDAASGLPAAINDDHLGSSTDGHSKAISQSGRPLENHIPWGRANRYCDRLRIAHFEIIIEGSEA